VPLWPPYVILWVYLDISKIWLEMSNAQQ